MKTVILAEKPDQALKYAAALGSIKRQAGYIELRSKILPEETTITWALGHLVGLAPFHMYDKSLKKWTLDTCPFLPGEVQYTVIESTKDQYRIVKAQLESADQIIIATDPDREGENVAYSIFKQCGERVWKTPKERLWLNSMAPGEIVRAFQHLRPAAESYPRYIEAQTRQISDWLVGLNMTRLFSLRLWEKGLTDTYSIGRVQTPCNAMIVENDRNIKAFRPERFCRIHGTVNKDGRKISFENNRRYAPGAELDEVLKNYGLEEAVQTEICSVETEIHALSAPRLFDLGGIQKLANVEWGYSLDKTLNVLQSLYQRGLLSYPRTNCDLIPESEFHVLRDHLDRYMALSGFSFAAVNTAPRDDYVDGDKVQEHYAIIPTETIPELDEIADILSEEEQRIYMAIVKRSIMMFAPDYLYEATEVAIEINGMFFKTRSVVPMESGWKGLESASREKLKPLPAFHEGEAVIFIPETKIGYTQEPARLTEAALGGKDGLMDKLNLGTPATRSEIIKTLVNRGYVRVEKTKLYPTDKGILLYECTKHTLLGKPEMTRVWEESLGRIGDNGQAALKRQKAFLDSVRSFCRSASEDLKTVEIPDNLVQRIKDGGVKRIGQYAISETKNKYVVTGEAGTFDIWKKRSGKTLTLAQLRRLLEKGRTGPIKGFRSKNGKKFNADLVLKGCEVVMEFENKTQN